MRTITMTLAAALVVLSAAQAVAQTVPEGIYDCHMQPQGTMKFDLFGILKITPEGFSGPQAEEAEDELYVYLLNPDLTLNLPNAFARNIENGVEVVSAKYVDFAATVQANVKMADGTIANVACNQRFE